MKIGNLYNLESFERFCDSAKQPGFQDSLAGVVLARNLTHVDPKLFEKKYPELALLTAGLDVDNSGGYNRVIQSLRVLDKGDFSQRGDNTDNKGKISLTAEDSTIKVYPHDGHSIWRDDEVKEAELQGINLPSQYVATHNRLYMRKVDEIGLIGVAGGTGLLNTTAFDTDSAADVIENLNASEMYQEFADLINAQWSAVNNTPEYKADRVMMPVRVMNKLQSTIMDTAAGTKNVLQALRDNFPSVQFLASFRGDTIANGGNLATSATVAFSSNAEAMKLRVPRPLEIGEIIKPSSFEFRVDSKFRIAGIDILEDTSGFTLTGL